MRLKITAKKQINEYGNETIRTIGYVETDSVNHALQMYEDDIRENERMEYEILN
jgi:hypothetical protein